jgi:hypothetical protein
MPLASLAPVLALPDVVFHPLTPGLSADVAAMTAQGYRVRDLTGFYEAGFDDVAAHMAALDAVVTIDSAPLHLGGALGRPVLAMLDHVSHWCWGSGETQPWYESVEPYRTGAGCLGAGGRAGCGAVAGDGTCRAVPVARKRTRLKSNSAASGSLTETPSATGFASMPTAWFSEVSVARFNGAEQPVVSRTVMAHAVVPRNVLIFLLLEYLITWLAHALGLGGPLAFAMQGSFIAWGGERRIRPV